MTAVFMHGTTALARSAAISLVATLLAVASVGATVRTVPEDYPTIQSAVDASASGDTVLLSPGVFRGGGNRNIDFGGRNIVLTSSHGPAQTVIDCENAGRGFYLHSFETTAARIERVTVRNGFSPTLGGGVVCSASSPTISECWILSNRARDGGGLRLGAFYGVVEDCIIAGNTADRDGGGIHLSNCSGGAFVLANCLISGNRSQGGGGGLLIACDPGTSTISNCTIAGNSAVIGGGMGVGSSGAVRMLRCIVRDNCGVGAGRDVYNTWGRVSFLCSSVDSSGVFANPATFDSYCSDEDPLFCDPLDCEGAPSTGGNYSLTLGSPCLAENSPCGLLIGGAGLGCPVADVDAGDGFEHGSALRAWPNPVRTEGRLWVTADLAEATSGRLYDAAGRSVCTLWQGIDLGTETATALLPGVNPGVYFLVVRGERERLSVRLTVTR